MLYQEGKLPHPLVKNSSPIKQNKKLSLNYMSFLFGHLLIKI